MRSGESIDKGVNVAFSAVAGLDPSARYRDDFVIRSLSTDTRHTKPGDVFVAIKGDRYDGHDFVGEAAEAGAAAVIARRDIETSAPVMRVADPAQTLGCIARLYRDQLPATVIGVTGSSGKTTVKGMLACVCKRHGRATATVANNNNIIGVSQTILSASREDKTLVVEMGTNAAGEMRRLAEVVHPDISVITNVSESHLDGLGDRDHVFAEKSAIISGARATATIVVNADDDYANEVIALAAASGRPTIKYGFANGADVRVNADAPPVVAAQTPQGGMRYRLNVLGRHNVSNSAAVAALGLAAGIDRAVIARGIEDYTGEKGRLQTRPLRRGITLIDDSYNANPASSHAALDTLGGFVGRKLFAYGGMAELGEAAWRLHKSVGDKANKVGVDKLYIYGQAALATYHAYLGEKLRFTEINALAEALAGDLDSGDTVLVKGSRRYRMERVCDYLQRQAG